MEQYRNTVVKVPDNIITYHLARVPFGIILSPFLLGATIKHHIQKEMSQILKYIYNDHLIFGVEREIQGKLHEPERMEIKFNQS